MAPGRPLAAPYIFGGPWAAPGRPLDGPWAAPGTAPGTAPGWPLDGPWILG